MVQQKGGWPSLHGPLVDRIGSGLHPKGDMARVQRLISGEQDLISFKDLIPMNPKARETKPIVAPVTGGNLCVLMSSLGTQWQFDPAGKLLFLEEIGEKPHRVDRFFIQLEQSGLLKDCRGIVLGHFLEQPKHQRMIWSGVISEFADKNLLPMFRGLPVGHGKVQKSLPFGTTAKLYRSGSTAKMIVSTGVEV